MAFEETNGNGMVMPVAPMYGNGGNGGFGFGGDWGWIILLLLCANGGWGFGGFGGGYGAMMGMDFGLYPWLNNSQNINGGFRDQMINTSINGIQNSVTSGFGDVQLGIAGVNQNICQTGNATVAAITAAQNGISQQLYNNEIANLNRSFAEQTANVQGFNSVNSGISDLRYTEATEACATRNANAQNTQTLLTALTAGVQSIKDQLCQDKIDAKNDEIAQLRQENLYARGQASQVAQNAAIINGIYDRLNQCPVGTVPVFGEQPIFTCPTQVNSGCGCGGNGF